MTVVYITGGTALFLIILGAFFNWEKNAAAGKILLAGAVLLTGANICFIATSTTTPPPPAAETKTPEKPEETAKLPLLPPAGEAADFVRESFNILKTWDYTELARRAAPGLMETQTEDEWKLRFAYYGQLGRPEKFAEPDGVLYGYKVENREPKIFGDYLVRADFSEGFALAAFSLMFSSGSWQINRFEVQSKTLPLFGLWKQGLTYVPAKGEKPGEMADTKADAPPSPEEDEPAVEVAAAEPDLDENTETEALGGATEGDTAPATENDPAAAAEKRKKDIHTFLKTLKVGGVSSRGAVLNSSFYGTGDALGPGKSLVLIKTSSDVLIFQDKEGNYYKRPVKMSGVTER